MVTVPVVLVVGLLLGGAGSSDPAKPPRGSGAPLPALTVPPPSVTDATTVSTCAQVISALPLSLAGHGLRLTVSRPASPSIVAWGDPAIVLRCGVAKPAALNPAQPGTLIQINHGVNVLPEKRDASTVFTVVDRAVYIEVTVPSSYPQPPLAPLADAIARVLPTPVCSVSDTEPDPAKLCTRRR